NGVLVQPQDPVGLAKALDFLLSNNARVSAMVERAETRAKAEFTWEANARKMLAVYQDQQVDKGVATPPEALPPEGVDLFHNNPSRNSEKSRIRTFADRSVILSGF